MTADELAKILDELGQRLGPTGQHVFDLAVRQVVIDNVIFLVWAALAIALAVWVYRRSLAADSIDSGPMKAIAIGMGVLAVLILGYSLSQMLNAEYAAIKSLLGALGR